MSKSLIVIRHAKSSWASAEGDHQRPLKERGFADANLIGGFLLQNDLSIDAVYCSDAKRALQTLQTINSSLKLAQSKVNYVPDLYLAELNELLTILNTVCPSIENLVLIGHNPGLTNLCNYLTNDRLENLPTCSVYAVELLVDDWNAVCEGVGIQKLYCTPRMLKETD